MPPVFPSPPTDESDLPIMGGGGSPPMPPRRLLPVENNLVAEQSSACSPRPAAETPGQSVAAAAPKPHVEDNGNNRLGPLYQKDHEKDIAKHKKNTEHKKGILQLANHNDKGNFWETLQHTQVMVKSLTVLVCGLLIVALTTVCVRAPGHGDRGCHKASGDAAVRVGLVWRHCGA